MLKYPPAIVRTGSPCAEMQPRAVFIFNDRPVRGVRRDIPMPSIFRERVTAKRLAIYTSVGRTDVVTVAASARVVTRAPSKRVELP